MKFVAILCLAIVAAGDATNGCMAYVCDPSDVTWADGVCAMIDSTNATRIDLRTGECSSDKPCPGYLVGGIVTSVSCVTPGEPQPVQTSYPGERCDRLHTCFYGTCADGTCPTTTPCVNVYDCGLGKTCSPVGTCTNLASANGACSVDTDCANGLGCDIAAGAAAGTGKCVAYSSVAAAGKVQSCTGTATTAGVHSLCASNYCYETATAGTFACTGAFTSTSTPPMRVATSTSACTSAKDTTSSLTLPGAPGCGYDGYPYCGLFTGDQVYTSYTSVITSFLASSTLSNCNTYRHQGQGNAFNVAGFFWCAQNITDSQMVDMYFAMNYPELVMAESCQIKILDPAYYKVEGAESLIFGGLLLALLQ